MIIITERQALFVHRPAQFTCQPLARVRHFTPEQRPLRSVRQVFNSCQSRPSESCYLTHRVQSVCHRAERGVAILSLKCD